MPILRNAASRIRRNGGSAQPRCRGETGLKLEGGKKMDQLSGMDASFLHLETPETPMHVGSLMLFELPEGYTGDYYEAVKALLGKRLHLSAFLNRKLAQMPFQLAEPVWIEDDDIDLDYHVRTVTLRRPGTMAQLEQLVARLHASLLDRSRPLWEMYVIDGLESGLVAFYTKAHHSGVDGKAGVELAKVLYDTSQHIREVPPPRRKRASGQYQLGVTELLQAAATNAAQQYRKLAELLPAAAKALDTAARVVASQRSEKGERSLNLGLAPSTIFNDSITNQRSYSTMSLSLAPTTNWVSATVKSWPEKVSNCSYSRQPAVSKI